MIDVMPAPGNSAPSDDGADGMTTAAVPGLRLDHLEWLEAEAIYILREVAAQCQQAGAALLGRQG